jgi:mannose-6-phosphate isomerase class I
VGPEAQVMWKMALDYEEKRRELADLKAELEMPSHEEVEKLRQDVEFLMKQLHITMQKEAETRERAQTLEMRHNELVTWLAQQYTGDDQEYMMRFLKVQEVEE